MFENEVCPNCECDIADSCCGDVKGFAMDEMHYCCRACAEDEECECGCQQMKAAYSSGGDKEGAPRQPGPIA